MIFYDVKNNYYKTDEIKDYQLIDSKKSGGSAIARAGLGAMVLGPVGLLAGATAKKKYSVLLIYKSGFKESVVLNESNLKTLMENV